MTDREGGLLLARLAVILVGLFMAVDIPTAALVGAAHSSNPTGGLAGLMMSGLILIFYAAPGLLIVFMASRSRRWRAVLVLAALCAGCLLVMQLFHLMPWQHLSWRRGNEAGLDLLIAVVFYHYPATLLCLALWVNLNRKPRAPPAAPSAGR